MPESRRWTISGSNPLADVLRLAARVIDSAEPVHISTEPAAPDDAVVVGPAILSSSADRFVPFYSAFEAIEAVTGALRNGEHGQLYGCFTSIRIARGATPDEVRLNALLPAIAVTLDLIDTPVQRIHSRRASLLADADAWFVTIRFADETIATIEAMACLDADDPMQLLVEVTASDRVLRAEPTRQAISVRPLGAAPQSLPWWEDLAERYLQLVARRHGALDGRAGSRVRAVWRATVDSANSGQPVSA